MNVDVEAARRRAAYAESWFKSIAAEQFGDQWLPLSIREHFGRDMPILLAATEMTNTAEVLIERDGIIRYNDADRGRYEPHACPECGLRVEQGWLAASTSRDVERMWVLGRWQCTTPGCPTSEGVAP